MEDGRRSKGSGWGRSSSSVGRALDAVSFPGRVDIGSLRRDDWPHPQLTDAAARREASRRRRRHVSELCKKKQTNKTHPKQRKNDADDDPTPNPRLKDAMSNLFLLAFSEAKIGKQRKKSMADLGKCRCVATLIRTKGKLRRSSRFAGRRIKWPPPPPPVAAAALFDRLLFSSLSRDVCGVVVIIFFSLRVRVEKFSAVAPAPASINLRRPSAPRPFFFFGFSLFGVASSKARVLHSTPRFRSSPRSSAGAAILSSNREPFS